MRAKEIWDLLWGLHGLLEALKDIECRIAVELIGFMEMNLGLKFWPLVKFLASEENDFGLDTLELVCRFCRRHIVQIPDVEVQLRLTTPGVTVITALTVSAEAKAKPSSHPL